MESDTQKEILRVTKMEMGGIILRTNRNVVEIKPSTY